MKRFAFLTLIVVLFIAACTPSVNSTPTPTSTSTRMPTATASPTPTMTAIPTEDPHEVIVREVDENVDFLPWYPMPVSSTLEDSTVIKYEWTNPALLVEIAGENLGITTLEDGETKSFTFRGINWTLYVKIENGKPYVADDAISANIKSQNTWGGSFYVDVQCSQARSLKHLVLFEDFDAMKFADGKVTKKSTGKTFNFIPGIAFSTSEHLATACEDGTLQVEYIR